ncbi:MAG TPA: ABC transporter ATP-binding protein [Ktedonobacteraceae bacterium]|nr:ABC transporter ATP-binding protein [Ktedonobacteraceae bacterium]
MRYRLRSRYDSDQPRENFQLKHVFASVKILPRIAGLVWTASPGLTFWTAALCLARGITPAISATITQLLFDGVLLGIKQQSISPIWLPVCLQLGVNLFDRTCTVVGVVIQGLLKDRTANHIQELVLSKANTLDMSQFENAEYYDTLRHATEEASYRPSSMISETFDLARTFITLCSMLFLIAHLSWWLVVVALVIPIPSFISSSRYGWKDYILARRQSPERRMQSYHTQLLTVDQYIKEIKLFNLGDFLLNRYKYNAEKLYAENKRMLIPRATIGLAWTLLTIIANSIIYLYIALQAVTKHISFGQLSKYVMAANSAGQSFQSVLDGFTDTYENSLFVNQLFEFLEYEPKIVSPAQPAALSTPAEGQGLEIEFRNVSFTYPGKEQAALKQVSFTLHAGETIALVGSNGAGKTTLVKLMSRLYDPDEGEILIGGRNVKEYDLTELREHIGVIFQDFVRYHMTANDNIGIGRVTHIENRELVTAAARKSGADRAIEQLTNGYEAMLGRWFEKGVELSGGQWQKIALARAFMRNAPILILDEPTSALDAQAEYDIFTRFRSLTESKTAIFISHRFSTVRLADRIFVLEGGTIHESGSHDELMALDGRYAELFNLQARAYH